MMTDNYIDTMPKWTWQNQLTLEDAIHFGLVSNEDLAPEANITADRLLSAEFTKKDNLFKKLKTERKHTRRNKSSKTQENYRGIH
jgi:hypothetical protein